MKKYIIALLSFFACSQLLFSQPTDQRKILANNYVKEMYAYKCTIKNGQPTGDSILVSISKYNPNGYLIFNVLYTPTDSLPTNFEYTYAYDTVNVKMVAYKNEHTIVAKCYDYKYDAAGKTIQFTNIYTKHSPAKIALDTFTVYMVYDSINRSKEVYSDYGNGKELSSGYEYDAKGNKTKSYYYYTFKGRKKIDIKEMEYDDKGRILKYYNIKEKKRKLESTNIYNTSGQLIENYASGYKKSKKYFGLIPYNVRKKYSNLTRYTYDEKGLLIREDIYTNEKLVNRYFYKYVL